MKRVCAALLVCFVAVTGFASAAETAPSRPQVAIGESLTITATIVAFDPATRDVTLRGPLGGVIEGVVSEEVKDLSTIKVGDLVSASYYQAIAASVHRKGDDRALVTAADVGDRNYPGEKAGIGAAVTESVTVVSVDVANNSVLFKDAEGTLLPTDVERPEFRAKLKDLKPGDVVDLTYSEALVMAIVPVKPGEEAKATMKVGTLVIDQGTVVKRMSHTLWVRNDRGRVIKVTVDPSFKFNIDGKEVTVDQLKEGTKLTRTAIRTREVSYSE